MIAFTGDRAGDLGSILTDQIKWLPNNKGTILCLVTGNTIDIRDDKIGFLVTSSLSTPAEITIFEKEQNS